MMPEVRFPDAVSDRSADGGFPIVFGAQITPTFFLSGRQMWKCCAGSQRFSGCASQG
jgi:hypothetical protein